MAAYPPNTSRPTDAAHRPRRTGFSLIELVMVIAIMSIIAAIAVPRYTDSLARYRADAAARRIVADLDYARKFARAQSTTVLIHIKPLQNILHMESVPSMDDTSRLWELKLAEAPYYADLVSNTFNASKLSINGYGVPDASGKIIVAVGPETRIITLDAATGKAVIQ